MYEDNSWYGHKKILLDYCKLKQKKIFGSLQHGWYSAYDTNSKLGVHRIKFIPHFCWNKTLVNKYKKQKLYAINIGSPFLYLLKRKKIKKKIIKNVIVFPAHSNELVKQTVNYENLIKEVENQFPGPYTVCLFYQDLSKKIITFFKKKNWKVVCAGTRKNKNFLNNLYKYLINHNNIVVTDIQTILFYSLFLKKKTYYIYGGKSIKINDISTEHQKKEFNFYKKKNIVRRIKNFYFFDKNKGFNLAKKNLGDILLKEDLKKLLKIGLFKNLILHLRVFFTKFFY